MFKNLSGFRETIDMIESDDQLDQSPEQSSTSRPHKRWHHAIGAAIVLSSRFLVSTGSLGPVLSFAEDRRQSGDFQLPKLVQKNNDGVFLTGKPFTLMKKCVKKAV